MMKRMIIGLVVLPGSALQAQTTVDYRVKAGLVSALGDLLNLTNKHQGHFFEGGASFTFKAPELTLYVHAGHLVVRRDKGDTANFCDVKNTWAGVDLQYPVNARFGLFTGPTLNQWDITAVTGPYPDTSWKLGWRLGGRYAFTKDWSVEATYSFAEWARVQRKTLSGALLPVEALRPSWYTVGAVYTF